MAESMLVESIMSLHRCAECPIRCRAMKQPYSLYARLHRWHKTWWPGWRIYQRELRAPGGRATAGA